MTTRANRVLRRSYAKIIRYATVGAIVFHVALLVLAPVPQPVRSCRATVTEDAPPVLSVVALDEERPVAKVPADTPMPDPQPAPDGDIAAPEPPPAPGLPAPDPGTAARLTAAPFVAFDELPVLIQPTRPRYPSLAREAGIEGRVVVRLLIDTKGAVIEASVLHSEVTPAMEAAAIEAALRCRFRPARQRSAPVRAYVTVPFVFTPD